jgi:hypothetical protein
MSEVYCTCGRKEECIQPVPRNGKKKDDMRDLDINMRIILQCYCKDTLSLG